MPRKAQNRDAIPSAEREQLLAYCLPIAERIARKFARYAMRATAEDLYHEAIVALLEIIDKGLPSHAGAHEAVLIVRAKWAIIAAFTRYEHPRREPHHLLSLDAPLAEDGFCLHDVIAASTPESLDNRLLPVLNEAINRLSSKQRGAILALYFGQHDEIEEEIHPQALSGRRDYALAKLRLDSHLREAVLPLPGDQQRASTPDASAPLDALDCAWCAAEQSKPSTDSPGICAYHTAIVLEQAAAYRARREAKQERI